MHETHWPMGLDNKRCSKYSLSGIIIHSGQATAGHYYTFIRRTDGSWEECNDLKISPWDMHSRMEADCYGGADDYSSSNYTFYSQGNSSKSAYMLIYKQRNSEKTVHRITDLSQFVPKSLGESIRLDNDIIEKIRRVYDPSYLNFLADLIVHIGETELRLCKANFNYAEKQQVDGGVELYCFVLRAVVYIYRNAKDATRIKEVSGILKKLFSLIIL